MSIQTQWVSPTKFVSGDPTLRISYPSVSHPAVEITTTAPGDLKWIYIGLCLPPCTEIKAIHVCYQLLNSRSFISQVRLAEMKTPERALVRHDDGTDLLSTDPTCYVSDVENYRPDGAVTLNLRLNFGDSSDKILLGAVGLDLRSYRTPVPTYDLRFSIQRRYAETDLTDFGITNNVVTIPGSALEAPKVISVSDFFSTDETTIREQLMGYLRRQGIDFNTEDLMVLDIEPGEEDNSERHSFAPKDIGNERWDDDDTRRQIIEGYKTRIRVAREVLPKAKLGLYQVIAPDGQGRENIDAFSKRIAGYRQAGALGMYDLLDVLVPVLYARWGPDDPDWINRIEASTRQGIEASLTLTRTDDKNLPLAPYLSFWVLNPNSMNDRQAILPEVMHHQLAILQEYCGIETIVMWAGKEEPECVVSSRDTVPVNLLEFLPQIGNLPADGCITKKLDAALPM